MQVSQNMDTLVFAPMYFYGLKGNVGNMDITRKRPNCQRAYMCHFSLYNIVSENHKVQNFTIGGGGLGPAKGLLPSLV